MARRRIATVVVLGGLASLVAAFVVPRARGAVHAEPREAPETPLELPTVDLGSIPGRGPSAGEVRIDNPSDTEWRLVHAAVDCGCVQLLAHGDRIPARGSLSLPLRLDPAGRSDPRVEQVVTVVVEPGPRRLRARVSASIRLEPRLESSFLPVSVGAAGEPWTAELAVRSPGPATVSLAGAGPAGSELRLRSQPSTELPSGAWRTALELSGRAPDPLAPLELELRVAASPGSDFDALTLQPTVHFERATGLRCEPPALLFTLGRAESVTVLTLAAAGPTATAVEVLDCPDWLRATAAPGELLLVSAAEGPPVPGPSGITLRGPSGEVVELPLWAVAEVEPQ
jgi:hypothetical protein